MSRETFSILGAGRLGRALGRLLAESGLTPGGIACRRLRSARQAVAFVGGGEPTTSCSRAAAGASLVILSTPDAVIAPLVRRLAASRSDWEGKVVVHTSGALSSEVLDPLSRLGARTASLHPLASVADPRSGVRILRGSRFTIEGDRLALQRLRRLVRSVGGVPIVIPGKAKALYHLIASLLSNDVVALLSLGLEAAHHSLGLSRREAAAHFLPLVRGTLGNVERLGPVKALTGPVSRGDPGTLGLHRAALRGLPVDLRRAHQILSRRAVVLALQARTITPESARRLLRLVASFP